MVTHIRIKEKDRETIQSIKLLDENDKDFLSRIIKEKKRELESNDNNMYELDEEIYYGCIDSIHNLIEKYGTKKIKSLLVRDLKIYSSIDSKDVLKYGMNFNAIGQSSIKKLKNAHISKTIVNKIEMEVELNESEKSVLHDNGLELVYSQKRFSFVRVYSGKTDKRMENLELANKNNPKKIEIEQIKVDKETLEKVRIFIMKCINNKNHTLQGMALSGLIQKGKENGIDKTIIKKVLGNLLYKSIITEHKKFKYKIVPD